MHENAIMVSFSLSINLFTKKGNGRRKEDTKEKKGIETKIIFPLPLQVNGRRRES